jgi:ABC-type sugar transport system, periplasmic component
MKKKIALVLAGMMVALSLVACTSNNDNKETTQETAKETTQGTEKDTTAPNTNTGEAANLSVYWWGNQLRNERTANLLNAYTEANPNVTFNPEFAEWDSYWNNLATRSAGNELPDIIQMDYKYLAQYANNGLLADLTPYIENGTLDVSNASEDIIEAAKVGDGIYAICIGINAPSLVYDKAITDEAGVEIKDNMTMAEFIEVSREIYAKTGVQTNIAYGNGDNFIEYFARSYGYILFEEGRLGVPDETVFKDYFQMYVDALDEGWHIDPSVFVEITPGSIETDPMLSKDTWCMFAYSNQIGAISSASPELDYGITTWPADDAVAANYLKPGQFFSISSSCANIEEAVKVLDYVTNSVDANKILLAERGIPISTVVADAIKPLIGEADQVAFDYVTGVVTENSSKVNPPSAEGSGEIQSLLNQLVEAVCYGQKTPEEAATEIFTRGNEILASKVGQ